MKVLIFISKSKIRINSTKLINKDFEFASKVGFLTEEPMLRAKY